MSRKRSRKTTVIAIGYLTWQVIFPIVVSPLVLGILTAEQMGYTWTTVYMGLLVGTILSVALGVLGGTGLADWLYLGGLRHIKTREEFEQFWTATLRGCDDGIIAETHWSGTILPLFMMAFGRTGLPYPFNAIPALFFRWLAHIGAHLMFPRRESGERIFGSLNFFAKGLALSDTINGLSFLVSGSIIAPAMLHHLSGYISTWAGNKQKIAKKLGIPLD